MGKFKTHLKLKKNEMIHECPICGSLQVEEEKQPQSGTHMFTRAFNCGTEIDFPIGYDGAEYGVTCTGEIKRFELPDFRTMSNAEKQRMKDILKKAW